MTWGEWVDSEYNTDGFYILEKYNYKYVFFSNGDYVTSIISGVVGESEIIQPISYNRFIPDDNSGGVD